ncbi:MgtC/SapB family protein [Microvirga antarctica]|uniref:MgtC/SapB family protein n=1 Tax=Microvirga antarctica TaxID=2819233 RepID=UPI001B300E7D|nr:MgtC/SapB family protein [Microvirga antarctica]
MITWPDVITDEHLEILLRLGAAMLAGMTIGINRDLHGKPIGVRTLGLVSLSSAIVVLAGSSYGDLRFDQDAVSRVIQGILTGLGFLGAGVILREESRLQVHGLTTAATVMAAATFGITAALGAWFLTFTGTVLGLTLLVFGKTLERAISHALKPHKPDLSVRLGEEIEPREGNRTERDP